MNNDISIISHLLILIHKNSIQSGYLFVFYNSNIEEMYQAPQNSSLNSNMQKVQIFLSARNLLDKDFFSKSDPYIKVYFKRGPNQNQQYIGKTQVINNNLNPNFTTSFMLDYIFQAHQDLRFQIFDYDDGMNDDYLGAVTCSLGAVAGSKSQTAIFDVKNKDAMKDTGKLIVRMETFSQSNIVLSMKWIGRKLLNTDSWFDFWDKSDPYLKFIKVRNDNSYVTVGQTNIIHNELNPRWATIEMPLQKLISPERMEEGKFKIQCWDFQQGGEYKHQFIGEIQVSYNQLKSNKYFPLQFPLKNKKHKNPGTLVLQNFCQYSKPGFMDYLKGGLELNLSIAIDFTGSNGIPTQPNSLHYIMDPLRPNEYQQAIHAVSRILLNYDTDKRIPCYAFGGKPHFPKFSSNQANHCFPLSGDYKQIDAYGVEHLMEMYFNALKNIQLAGPTYFNGIISQAIKTAKLNEAEGSNTYQILLILTDGQIHDMQKTTDLLVESCDLPLSLIIVGVGGTDFTNMNVLDGDNGLYSSQGRKANRDIVQFVPFRNVGLNPDLLAQQLLAELPTQVVQYMTLKGKKPNPPVQINFDNLIKTNDQINPQQAMQAQVTNMFQNANFFDGF